MKEFQIIVIGNIDNGKICRALALHGTMKDRGIHIVDIHDFKKVDQSLPFRPPPISLEPLVELLRPINFEDGRSNRRNNRKNKRRK